MDCSTPGFPVLHYLPEFAQTQVHWVEDGIQQSHQWLLVYSKRYSTIIVNFRTSFISSKVTLYLLAISFRAPSPPPLNRFTICIPIGKIKRAGYRAIQGTFLRSKHQEVVEPGSPTQGVRVHTLSPHHEDERMEVREAPVRRCHAVATSKGYFTREGGKVTGESLQVGGQGLSTWRECQAARKRKKYSSRWGWLGRWWSYNRRTLKQGPRNSATGIFPGFSPGEELRQASVWRKWLWPRCERRQGWERQCLKRNDFPWVHHTEAEVGEFGGSRKTWAYFCWRLKSSQ